MLNQLKKTVNNSIIAQSVQLNLCKRDSQFKRLIKKFFHMQIALEALKVYSLNNKWKFNCKKIIIIILNIKVPYHLRTNLSLSEISTRFPKIIDYYKNNK